MDKEQTIKLIAGRIRDEYRKHSHSIEEWPEIAASKLYSQWSEFFSEQSRQAAVSGSVCDHEFTEPVYGRESEFKYYECRKCGQTDR